MWHLTDRERAILRKVIPTDLISQTVPSENGTNSFAIITNREYISASEVETIYRSLPPSTEFHHFINSLRLRSSTADSTELTNEQQEAKRSYREGIERLKQRQENLEYAKMTKSIDPSRVRPIMENFGKEMRQVNRQMMCVVNTLITVGGAFAFGFVGIEFAYPHLKLDIATRMLLGLVLATIVFFADLYFLVKDMSIDEVREENKCIIK